MAALDHTDWAGPEAIASAIANGDPGGAPGGVPLLHGQSVLSVTGPTLLLPNNNVTATLTHINIGYELEVAIGSSIANVNAQCSVEILFIDQASGTVVDKIAYVFWPPDASTNNFITVYGKGPTRGNQMTLRITNQAGNNPIQYQYVFSQSGRPYAYDYMKPTLSPVSASGRNVPSADFQTGILAAHLVNALGAGATQTDQLPPYWGRAHIHWDSASNTNDCEVSVDASDDSLHALSIGRVFDQFTGASGNGDSDLMLPSTQCVLRIINHNAAAKNVAYVVTGEPY